MSHEEKIARLSARIAELEGAMREIVETWGTQHIGECPVGRGMLVLGGGAR